MEDANKPRTTHQGTSGSSNKSTDNSKTMNNNNSNSSGQDAGFGYESRHSMPENDDFYLNTLDDEDDEDDYDEDDDEEMYGEEEEDDDDQMDHQTSRQAATGTSSRDISQSVGSSRRLGTHSTSMTSTATCVEAAVKPTTSVVAANGLSSSLPVSSIQAKTSAGRSADGDDEFKYEVLTPDKIVQYMIECIKDVNQVLELTPTTTRILLHHFRWDKEKLMERFYDGDQDRLFAEAHIVNPFKSYHQKVPHVYPSNTTQHS